MSGSRLRLHGYAVSNYVNIVRAALIEKRLDHDLVDTRASQEADFLAVSPMGKIPVLETGHGWLGETVAILDYLDDAFPETPLRPAAIGARARSRQLINVVQVYVETPARSLYHGVFGNAAIPDAIAAASRGSLDRGTAALARLMQPQPFLFGDAPGQADLFAFYNLDIVDRVTRFAYGRSIVREIGVLGDWWPAMQALASNRTIMADFRPALANYLASHHGRLDPAAPSGLQPDA